MTLEAGTRFGPYAITGSIGAGGMGEVYRARDSNLQRDVAIKILPAAFLHDPRRRSRFEREARLLALLNHPHIGAIYGIEEAEGLRGLVLELITGPTLSERIAQGSLSLREALQISRQVAEALEAAHAKGIVHRDLKPANIMLADGNAKVLDFGIATINSADDAAGLTALPTLTAGATREGVVVGTAAYMSPEQARGLPVDKRTDVWAFGCVLYEMLSGRRAFQGQTISDTIARILDHDPAWDALPKATSPAVVRLLQRCLDKDLDRRLHDIGDARIELEDELAASRPSSAVIPDRGRTRLAWITSAVLGVIALATGTVTILHLRERPTVPEPVTFTIFAPPGSSLARGLGVPTFAVSPDGRHIVFLAESQLWLRPFASPLAQVMPDTRGAQSPFWSPDGRFIAFFAARKLKKIQVSGGPPIDLTDVSIGRGGTWNRDNDIIFATVAGPLQKVGSSGGSPTPVTTLDTSRGDVSHLRPHFLPDGRHFLFAAAGGAMEIRVGSLDSAEVVPLTPSDSGGMYAAGHLVFVRGGNLLAQPLDPDTRRLTGEPFPIAAEVRPPAGLDFQLPFAVSAAGVLAYAPRVPQISRLTWFDRKGKSLGTIGDAGNYRQMALSPDGQRIAVALGSGSPEIISIWVIDAVRGDPTRLTFGPGSDSLPLWSPDGRQLAYNSLRDGPHNLLFRRPSNAGGQEEVLMKSELATWLNGWSSDGRFIVYTSDSVATGADLRILRLAGDRTSEVFLQTPSNEQGGAFSPDGRWIAYMSNPAGRNDVFVRPFPPTSEQHQLSRAGGSNPMWRADGNELYFVAPDGLLMAADIDTRTGFEASNARKLFPIPSERAISRLWHQYDVTKDGSRFLMIVPEPLLTPASITVVLNWPALLKKN